MKCESCNQRQATIAFTRIAGDDKQVLHLCPHCAEIIARQQKGTGEEMGEASQAGTPPASAAAGSQPAPDSPGDGAGEASAAPPQGPGADKPPARRTRVSKCFHGACIGEYCQMRRRISTPLISTAVRQIACPRRGVRGMYLLF